MDSIHQHMTKTRQRFLYEIKDLEKQLKKFRRMIVKNRFLYFDNDIVTKFYNI